MLQWVLGGGEYRASRVRSWTVQLDCPAPPGVTYSPPPGIIVMLKSTDNVHTVLFLENKPEEELAQECDDRR